VRYEGTLIICTIAELADKFGEGRWIPSTEPGKQEKEFCELIGLESWTEQGWTPLYRVIRHQLAPHKKMIRILTATGLVDVTDDHSLLLPDGQEISPNDVKFNMELLHHKIPEDSYILENLPFDTKFSSGFSSKNHLSLAKVCTHVQSLGQNISICKKSSDGEFAIYFSESGHISMNTIKYKAVIPYEGYVYDLTTENHHFAAGVGNLIVHNTDSVFFTFNLIDPKTNLPIRGEKALEATIEIAQDAAHL
jgi:intein/homing endonuclease